MKRSRWSVLAAVVALGAGQGGCAVRDATGAESEGTVAEVSAELLGPLSLASCDSAQTSLIERAVRVGRVVAATETFQSCVLTAPHTPCNDGNVTCVFGGECDDPSEGLPGAAAASLSPNGVHVTCADLGAPRIGNTPWGDQHDYDYEETERFQVDRAFLNGLATTGAAARYGQVAGVVWHEAMHVHGYDHGTGPSDDSCDGGDGFVWNVTTVPYLVERCMRAMTAPAIGLAIERGRGTPATPEEIDSAAEMLASGWGLDDVAREFAGIQREARDERVDFAGGDHMHHLSFASGRLDSIEGLERAAISVYLPPPGEVFAPRTLLALGRFCDDEGCVWDSRIQTVPTGAPFADSVGIATADLTHDGRDEVIVSAVSAQDGNDDWWVVVGFDCASSAGCTWGAPTRIPTGGSAVVGGGIAAGQLDLDADVELVVGGIDHWDSGLDYWRYAIGSCDGAGRCGFASVATHLAYGDVMYGGDVAMGNLDSDLVDEVVLSGVDHWSGADYIRYTIASSCSDTTCDFGLARGVSVGGTEIAGGGLAIADLTLSPGNEIVFSAMDQWSAGDDAFRFVVADCDADTRDCTLPHAPETVWTGALALWGSDVEARSVDGDTIPELIFGGLDASTSPYFGRFVTLRATDRTRLSTWLGVEPDPSDPGDTAELARVVPYPFVDLGLAISSPTDSDYFRFVVPSEREVWITVDFTHAEGDLDVGLTDGAGAPLGWSVGVTDHEEIAMVLPAGEHVVAVYGYRGSTGPYRLRIRDRYIETPDFGWRGSRL